MNAFDRAIKRAAHSEPQELPPAVRTRILHTLSELPDEPSGPARRARNPVRPFSAAAVFFSDPSEERRGKRRRIRNGLLAAAAVLLLFIAIPNLSMRAAAAMRELPVIGRLVDVILIRNYLYEDGHHYADIAVPRVTVEAEGDAALEKAVRQINDDVELLTQRLIQEFEADAEAIGEEGHTEIDAYYRTVTDSETWFTLEVQIYYGSGSGSVSYKYYHIDKTTGRIMHLSDLFAENSDYVTAISDWILARMREQMADDTAVYWIDNAMEGNEFHAIDANQNFFFAENGNLVIQFDEYEVAPGASGTPRFEIPREVYEEYLREGY